MALLLSACATSTPLTEGQFARIRGKNVYGVVLRLSEGVEEDVARSPICVRQDMLCSLMRVESRKLQYATVHLYGSVVFLKVFVPRGATQMRDIIKIRVPQAPEQAPSFVEVGAKSNQRNPNSCDWVDGSMLSLRGGVVCNGWSYRTIEDAL